MNWTAVRGISQERTENSIASAAVSIIGLLIENAGEVVTRDEICRELWPADTFVDFDHSLAAAVNKIREALGDSADNPKYYRYDS